MISLSVIIPTYNRSDRACQSIAAYYETLRSASEKTGITVEFIIVDDCSTDGNFDCLKTYFSEFSNVRIIKMPTNFGPGPARNAGLNLSTGTWIWFLDDDDELNASTLPILLRELVSETEGCDLLAHSLKFEYKESPQTNRLAMVKQLLSFHEHQEVFRYIARRSLITANNITFSPGLHEDIRFVYDLLSFGKTVKALPYKIIKKNKSYDAITSKITVDRISGYVRAFNEITASLGNRDFDSPKIRTLLRDQTLGVLLYLIAGEPDDSLAIELLAHLRTISSGTSNWSQALSEKIESPSNTTNFKYAGAIWSRGTHDQKSDAEILDSVRSVFLSRLSCKDLDSSIFLGPDEIRACCKRFFVGGVRKGDVVLLKATKTISISDIESRKAELISRINSDEDSECSGCPYIQRQTVTDSGIDYISLENFSYCNMRCTYCSPKYYGGTEAAYSAADIVSQLTAAPTRLARNCHVVWGGGEPTLSPHFSAINTMLSAQPQIKKVRVLSNCLRYSTTLERNLENPHFHLVTSVDAGTDPCFLRLRGTNGLSSVLNNIARYSQKLDDPKRLTVKYIVCQDNFDTEELQAFVFRLCELIEPNCLFQISCDFNDSEPSVELICALYELAARLRTAGARWIFFDDLVRDRVSIDKATSDKVRRHLSNLGLDCSAVLTPESKKSIVLWGVGMQANWLLKHTECGKSGKILAVIEDDSKLKRLNLHDAEGVDLYPAGVQSMYEILRNIELAGLLPRVFSGVIL